MRCTTRKKADCHCMEYGAPMTMYGAVHATAGHVIPSEIDFDGTGYFVSGEPAAINIETLFNY